MNKVPAVDLNFIAQAIYDKKGFNILVLDVKGVSTMTDYFIIAEGTVDRHVKAIGQMIIDELEKKGHYPFLIEGQQEGDWMVLDYTDFVVHLFTPELREKYRLEELWNKGKIVDVQIDISKSDLKYSARSSNL
jgi:ribosome-associated protein